MRSGGYGAKNPALPYTPGSDAAGTVEALGAGMNQLKIGARVYTTGTLSGAYAEFRRLQNRSGPSAPRAHNFFSGRRNLRSLCDRHRALFQLARVKSGETVLVHGSSGGVGVAAIQWAQAAGLKVIGTAGTGEGLRLIKDQGAEHAFRHDSADYQEAIRGVATGSGINVILEMLANVNLSYDLKMLARRGRVVVIGSRGEVQINPRDIMTHEASVMGVLIWLTPPADAAEIFAAIDAGLRNETLQPVIGTELPLADAAEAHRRVMAPGACGKIVLTP